MKTTLDIPDAHYREFKAKTASGPSARRRSAKSKLPEWAGIAEPFITKYPDDPLDSEKARDDIVAARRHVHRGCRPSRESGRYAWRFPS